MTARNQDKPGVGQPESSSQGSDTPDRGMAFEAVSSVRGVREVSREEMERLKNSAGAVVLDMLADEEDMKNLRSLGAELADEYGNVDFAAKLRGSEPDTSIKAKLGRLAKSRIQVWHVAVVVVGGMLLWTVYEAVAGYFGWGFRMGWFGESKDAAPRLRARTA